MKVAIIWIIWLALVFYWLSPEIASVKDKVAEHNAQIEQTLKE